MKEKLHNLMPSQETLKNNSFLRFIFGSLLFDPRLWYLNKNTISIGVGMGFFVGYLPIPMQMALTVLLALLFRFNLPASLAVVWMSNPFTWLGLYYPAFILGATILGHEASPPSNLSIEWLMSHYPPLFLGCTILGICGGLLAMLITRLLWRLHIINRWQERKTRLSRKKRLTP